jgi:hypothetical protein
VIPALAGQIVQEWVRQISHHQQHYQVQNQTQKRGYDEDLELERFAWDVAENLVAKMEKTDTFKSKVWPHTSFPSFHSVPSVK